jgi:hypothetical protein
MGLRPQGVTTREVEEEFEVTFSAAWRYVQRLVREGMLVRTDRTRRRNEVFGESWPGCPGAVYRAMRPSDENRLWVGLPLAQRPRRHRGRL